MAMQVPAKSTMQCDIATMSAASTLIADRSDSRRSRRESRDRRVRRDRSSRR